MTWLLLGRLPCLLPRSFHLVPAADGGPGTARRSSLALHGILGGFFAVNRPQDCPGSAVDCWAQAHGKNL